MKITEDIRYIGVNDHDIDLFEGQYVVKNGMAYNSYKGFPALRGFACCYCVNQERMIR